MDGFYRSDDGTLTRDHAVSKWCDFVGEAAIKLGRPFEHTDKLGGILEAAGFTDVITTYYKWPTNCWPKDKKYKEIGAWNNENATRVLESVSLAPFTRGLGWSSEEVNAFLVDVRKDLNDPKIHAYSRMYVS